MFFGPSADDAPSLIADIKNTLTTYEGEYDRAIRHLELLVNDMIRTATTRKPTVELVRSVNQTHDEVKQFLAEARHYVQAAETVLDVLRNEVLSLEHVW